jgi:hypothetical protein
VSVSVAPSQPVTVGLRDRLAAATAVGLARVIARLPPKRIRELLTKVKAGARPAGYAETRAARDTVLTVSVRCCGLRACLPRSIAVALLCRARGVWPTWCVGVIAAPPFTAHAWVEADDLPVDELVEAKFLKKLFDVAP